jgi:hypothetical protein
LALLLPGAPRSLANSRLFLSPASFFSLPPCWCSLAGFGGEPASALLGGSLASWSVQFSGWESLSARRELSSLCLSTPRSGTGPTFVNAGSRHCPGPGRPTLFSGDARPHSRIDNFLPRMETEGSLEKDLLHILSFFINNHCKET